MHIGVPPGGGAKPPGAGRTASPRPSLRRSDRLPTGRWRLPSHDNHPHPAGLGSGGGSSDGSEGSGRRGAGSANGSHEGGASSSGAVVGTSGWQAPEIMALRTAAERAGTHGTILDPAGSNLDDPARDTTGPGLDGHDIDGDAGQEAEGES